MKTITPKELRPLDDPGDGWHMIEAYGEHPYTLKDGTEILQVVDNEAVQSMIENFTPELMVDKDHLSHNMENDTGAMAWAKELAGLDDGSGNLSLAGLIEYSSAGLPLVKGKVYKRGFSTEYPPEDMEELGDGRFRPRRLAGLALTNRGNNKGQRPISNREQTPEEQSPDEENPQEAKPPLKNSESETPKQTPPQESMDTIAELKKILGLPEEATEQEVLDAVTALSDTAVGAATNEAETLIGAEGLADLPDEVKQDIIDELVTNRARGLRLLETLKNRAPAPATGQPRYAGPSHRPSIDPKASKVKQETLFINRAHEIQASHQSRGRRISLWKAREQAIAEYEKAGKA